MEIVLRALDYKILSVFPLTSARPQLTAWAWQSSPPTAWSPQDQSCYELEMWKYQQTPVLEGRILTTWLEPPNGLIPPNGIKVHDRNIQGTISDLLPGNIKLKSLDKEIHFWLVACLQSYLVKHWIKIAFVDRGLLLFYPFVSKHQPYLHIRVCQNRKNHSNIKPSI